jgi:hypothetical protein
MSALIVKNPPHFTLRSVPSHLSNADEMRPPGRILTPWRTTLTADCFASLRGARRHGLKSYPSVTLEAAANHVQRYIDGQRSQLEELRRLGNVPTREDSQDSAGKTKN